MDKKLIAIAVSSALAAPMAAQAVDFKTSGHINRMIRFVDDGENSDIQFTDNTASRSRVRFVGSSDVGNGLKAGVRLEIGLASNRSGNVKVQDGDTGDSFEGLGDDIRHSALWFSGNWGKVTAGHTSSASDGMSGADLRGTWMADHNTSYGACSSCNVYSSGDSGRNRPDAVGSLSSFHGTFDGGRRDVLRYDTPSLGPATIAVSAGNKGYYDIGGYVNTDVGGGALALSAGYAEDSDRSGYDQYAVAGSFRFSQGTAIQLVYSARDYDESGRSTADNFFASLGHRWGANRASISWGTTDDKVAGGSEAERFGIGWQHEMSKSGITLYAAYHNYDQELNFRVNGTKDTEDLHIVRLGTRVQFK